MIDQCYYQAEEDLNAVPDDGEKSVTDNGEEDTRNIANADIIDHIKAINGMATSNSQDSEERTTYS
jgi:hypothetical protein